MVQEAARCGKQMVDRLFMTVNQFMTEQLAAIKMIEKKLGAKGRQLITQANKSKQKLLDKLNATAVSLSRDMHFAASNLTMKLDAQLNPLGKEPIVAPAYKPQPAKQLIEALGPGGAFQYVNPQQIPALPREYTPEQQREFGAPWQAQSPSQGMIGGSNAPLQAQPDIELPETYDVSRQFPALPALAAGTQTPAAAAAALLQAGVPPQPALPVPAATAGASAVASALVQIAQQIPAERLAAPVVQVSLAELATILCHCLRAGARQDPVDFDQPNALIFGERNAPWHRQMRQFYQGGLDELLTAQSIDEVAAAARARSPRKSPVP